MARSRLVGFVLLGLLAAPLLTAGIRLGPAAATPAPPAVIRLNDPSPHLPHVLRFRVIANADTPYDEAVKVGVRNLVLADLDPILTRVHSPMAAEAAVRRELPTLQAQVRGLLKQDHVAYGASIRLGLTAFPAKAYGTWVLPAGAYQALIVRLGAGRGHNWWCVLFPSLCFIDTETTLAIPAAAQHPRSRPTSTPAPRVVWWLPFRSWLGGL